MQQALAQCGRLATQRNMPPLLQGGDPTGTGRGGTSIYGGKFEDEITRALKHTVRVGAARVPSLTAYTCWGGGKACCCVLQCCAALAAPPPPPLAPAPARVRACSPWPMQGPTPMAASSLSPARPRPGWVRGQRGGAGLLAAITTGAAVATRPHPCTFSCATTLQMASTPSLDACAAAWTSFNA